MRFTVAICSWNGADRLPPTLESFCQLQPPQSGWELIVVDNNSTDDTADIAESFGDRLPIRVVHESQQGHSFSRNRALDHARGSHIAWTDDDVRVAPDWLIALDRAVDAHPTAAFFGGKIIPFYEHSVPRWVQANWDICRGVFAERDLGNEPFEITTPEQLPYGANFVTRTSIQQKFRFDPSFGRQGFGARGFDEIDVLSRMLDSGYHGRWVPGAEIQHLIPPSRTTLDYLARYYQGQGETWIVRGISNLSAKQIRGRILRNEIRYFFARCLGSRRWIPILTETSNLRGQLKALADRD